MSSCEYWEIFKKRLFYRTPLVAVSGIIFSVQVGKNQLAILKNRKSRII